LLAGLQLRVQDAAPGVTQVSVVALDGGASTSAVALRVGLASGAGTFQISGGEEMVAAVPFGRTDGCTVTGTPASPGTRSTTTLENVNVRVWPGWMKFCAATWGLSTNSTGTVLGWLRCQVPGLAIGLASGIGCPLPWGSDKPDSSRFASDPVPPGSTESTTDSPPDTSAGVVSPLYTLSVSVTGW